jgi:hypothetical protein
MAVTHQVAHAVGPITVARCGDRIAPHPATSTAWRSEVDCAACLEPARPFPRRPPGPKTTRKR